MVSKCILVLLILTTNCTCTRSYIEEVQNLPKLDELLADADCQDSSQLQWHSYVERGS